MRIIITFLLLATVIITGCKRDAKDKEVVTRFELAKPMPVTDLIEKIPELALYHRQLLESLKNDPPVLLLDESEIRDSMQAKAQLLAVADKDFTRDVYHPETSEPLRNEIMESRRALPSEIPQGLECPELDCYRVTMYNYFFNSTVQALVDIKKGEVVHVKRTIDAQAEINRRLTNIAINIAINSPEVIAALGINPTEKDATMPNVKTALSGTRCERSKHLCVAPTFINNINKKALFAIVDLTDWQLVGIAWTELGDYAGDPLRTTEMQLQNEYVYEMFCEKNNTSSFGDWKVNYRITSSDGLEVFDVKYKDEIMINSSKIVDWHVSYLYKEGTGYSDATGCPMFSSSAVVAFNGPYIEDIFNESGVKTGHALVQDFRSPSWPAPCNYRYQNRYEFYNDGSFRIAGVNHGRGCNTDGMYKPVFRINLNTGEGPQNFAMWNGSEWNRWNEEQWFDQRDNAKYTRERYWMRLTNNEGNGFYIEPDIGQYGKTGRGDDAFVYVSAWHPDIDEGDTDLVTIGSCCNYDYRQGPEKFIEPPESLEDEKLILWYVPRMVNDNTKGNEYCWATTVVEDGKLVVKTWPGIIGPRIIPVRK